MDVKIAANIRSFRKARKLTQEQLAEVLGVTVGAVSKWESGTSMPDVSLIVGMAEFFETSVDVLLGYEWRGCSLEKTLARIKALRNAKDFAAAANEAEKALVKYPNNFDVCLISASVFTMKGLEQGHKKSILRSIELLERALELIAQNTNEYVNEWTIRNDIALGYLCLERYEEGVETLKHNNVARLNDGLIGHTLAVCSKKPDEALPYLSKALVQNIDAIQRVVIGFASAYSDKGDLAAAQEILDWSVGILRGLQKPGIVTYLDKEIMVLWAYSAVVAAKQGDMPLAREHLLHAKECAMVYDAAPAFGFTGMKHFYEEESRTAFDDLGGTAIQGIRQMLKEHMKDATALLKVWDELNEAEDGGRKHE